MAPTRTVVSLEWRLARHLAAGKLACMALASLPALVAANDAQAAVRYRAFNVPIAADVHGLYLNVETGAAGSTAGDVLGWDLNPYGPSSLTFYNASGTGMMRQPGTINGSAAALLPQTLVGSAASFGSGSVVFGSGSGNWQLNAINLFGFRFVAADGFVRYGWGRIEVGPTLATRTLVDIAYEDAPGTAIYAGATSSSPPIYDRCAATNPVLSVGANMVPLEQSTAPDLDLRGTSCGLLLRRANAFRFVAPASGAYTVSTCASGANTRLAVLDGCGTGAAPIACNDDFCGLSSSATFTAVGGQAYYIAVGATLAKATLPSPMSITVTPPSQPACTQAGTLRFGANSFSNAASTMSQDVRSSAAGATATIRKAIWYRFVPAVTGAYSFSMCGSSGDSMLAIADTCPGAGARLESIGFNDDFCQCSSGCVGNYAAWLDRFTPGLPLTQDLIGGQTYYLVAGSFAEASSVSASLVVDGPSQPPSNPADLNGDGAVNALDLAVLLSQWGGPGSADLDGNGVVGSPDLATLLNAWG